MPYRVERSDSATAEHTLVRLWTDNLNMRADPRYKFEWFYRDTPLGAATAFLLHHAPDDQPASEVVGTCGVGTRHVSVDGEILRSALFADFAVDKAHRTLMPALMLQRALCEYATSSFDMAYAFPNSAAVGIFNRIGLKTLGRTRRYVRILRSAPHLERLLKVRPLARIAGAFVDTALVASDRVRSAGLTYRFEWLPDADERFDRLWNAVRSNWKIIGERNSQFLRWRFTHRPGVPARLAALVHRRSGEIAAYAAVVDKDPGEALVADFLAASDAELTLLLRMLGPQLAGLRYTRALTYFLGPRRIDSALQKAGFQFRNDAKFVIVGAREGAPASGGRLARVDDWYVTEADRDN